MSTKIIIEKPDTTDIENLKKVTNKSTVQTIASESCFFKQDWQDILLFKNDLGKSCFLNPAFLKQDHVFSKRRRRKKRDYWEVVKLSNGLECCLRCILR